MGMSAAPFSGSVGALPDGTHVRHRLLAAAGVAMLAAGAVAALPGLDEVRQRFAAAAPGWLALVLVLEIGSCLAFVAVFRGVFCARLGWGPSYHLGMAVQGINVLLPAGGASGLGLGAWALNRMGVPGRQLGVRSVGFFVLTSAVNFGTAAVVGTALALGVLGGDVSPVLTAGPAVLAASAILAVAVLPRWLPGPRPVGGPGNRLLVPIHGALSDGVREAGRLLASGHALIVVGAIGYMAFDVMALIAAFAALGSVPHVGLLVLAYVVGQLGGLLPVPGGVGGADGGLIAALVVYGTPLAEAAAAVLAYRAFQLGLPAVLGTLAAARLADVLAGGLGDDSRVGDPLLAPAPVVGAAPAVPIP